MASGVRSLLGTTYGGDGRTNFALPDLRGRIPIHQGNGFILAETGGAEEITLTVTQIPNHNHVLRASAGTGYVASPVGALPARHRDYKAFQNAGPSAQNMHVGTLTPVGGSQPHENTQPFLCLNFIISLFGVFPSQT